MLLVQTAHLLDLLHRLQVHVSDLLLDDVLFGGLGHRRRLLLLLLQVYLMVLLLQESSLLLSLSLMLNLLSLAWFLAELMAARVLPFVPATAATTWATHHSDYTITISLVSHQEELGYKF